jgi:hypothetical protein
MVERLNKQADTNPISVAGSSKNETCRSDTSSNADRDCIHGKDSSLINYRSPFESETRPHNFNGELLKFRVNTSSNADLLGYMS